MSNFEGEGGSRKYFIIHTSTSIFDIPCSLFDILIMFFSYNPYIRDQHCYETLFPTNPYAGGSGLYYLRF
jgi:hypothetical protein